MRDTWLELVDSILRPARPELERCLREREDHLSARRVLAEDRARLVASCVRRIESARAEVFAANDGIITARMTDLEREWRLLSRPDPDRGLMDLWARITPASWIDRKRWRDNAADAQVDVAIALASDVSGVEAAEVAVAALRVALAPWGTPIGPRIRWRLFDRDSAAMTELLAAPLRAAREAVDARGIEQVVLARAQDLEREVLEAASVRFPEHPLLVGDLGHAAFVDYVWTAASLPDRRDPVAPLRAILKEGYVLAVDTFGMLLELPPL